LKELDLPDAKLHKPRGEVYYLRSVAVMKEHQGTGFGKSLIRKQLENARILGKKYFRFTASKNVEGVYLKLGFRKISDYAEFHGTKQAPWETLV